MPLTVMSHRPVTGCGSFLVGGSSAFAVKAKRVKRRQRQRNECVFCKSEKCVLMDVSLMVFPLSANRELVMPMWSHDGIDSKALSPSSAKESENDPEWELRINGYPRS